MRRERRTERSDEIEQPMRLQARNGDARKVERIDPRVLEQWISARVARGERAVELRVMGNDLGISHEFHQSGQSFLRLRCRGDVGVMDVREMSHLFGNGLPRIHERHEPLDDFPAIHTGSGDLGQFIVVERKPRCLRVKHHDGAVKFSEIQFSGQRRERRVPCTNGIGRSVAYEALQSILLRSGLCIHTVQPIIYH